MKYIEMSLCVMLKLQGYSQSRRTACRGTERGLEGIPTASSIHGLWGFQELYQAKSWNGREP